MTQQVPQYKVTVHDNEFHKNHWCIEIEEGDLQGLVYQYDTVKVVDKTDTSIEGNDGNLHLDFTVIDVSNPKKYDLTDQQNIDIMGQVLVKILDEHMELGGKLEFEEDNDDNRAADTEESN